MTTPVSSLLVGDRVVSRCDDGLLEAEYALFDRSEVLLASGVGASVYEEGYMTTAGFARARLNEALITADLAHEAYGALRSRHMRPLARSPAVVEIIDQLGPYEAFEGGRFVAERGRYLGLWIDLDALAAACPLRDAATLLQSLHLLLVLEEVSEDVPVRLLTAQTEAEGKAGERTWRKVNLDAAQRLPFVLREMQASTRPNGALRDEAEVREDILRNLQARATSSATAQPRLNLLASAIARTGWTPPAGTPIEPAPPTKRMSSKPPRPSSPPTRPGPGPRLPSPMPPRPGPGEEAPDPTAMFESLRHHTDLLRGTDHLRAVAQSLSSLAERSPGVSDLAILAARAWLAAGEHGYARHFARRIVEDAAAVDDVRIAALEILEAVPRTNLTAPPPAAAPIQPSRVIVLAAAEEDRPAPPGASLPPMSAALPTQATQRIPPIPPAPRAPTFSQAAPQAVPVYTPEPARRAEIVETLPLPAGLNEDMLAAGVLPRNAVQARIGMTRLARQLGRDYRLAYGTALKTDLMAIEAMQRHLRRRWADGPLDAQHQTQLQIELARHGALMSEILARRLCGEWVDLSGDEPGRWAMHVPPGAQVWPIGRVYRFYGQGHREADLVHYFMELEAAFRRGR